MLLDYDAWLTREPDVGIEEHIPDEDELDAMEEERLIDLAFRTKRDLVESALRTHFNRGGQVDTESLHELADRIVLLTGF